MTPISLQDVTQDVFWTENCQSRVKSPHRLGEQDVFGVLAQRTVWLKSGKVVYDHMPLHNSNTIC